MVDIVNTLLPVFMLIILGYFFKTKKIFAEGFWSGVEHLCYYILFPALIIRTLALTDFNKIPAVDLSFTMGGAVIIMLILLTILSYPAKKLSINGAAYSSIFQGATRWNTFALLAIIDAFYGDFGLSIASIAVAVMIPMLNIANVTALAILTGKDTPTVKKITLMLVKNPLIIGCFIGLGLNFTGIPLWEPIANLMQLLGRSAMALSLMAVGVGVSFKALQKAGFPVLFTTLLKLVLMPFLMYFLCDIFGVVGIPRTVAILCGAAPTAAASFILARKMGGDAELMANIISIQTLISVATIPIILYFIGV